MKLGQVDEASRLLETIIFETGQSVEHRSDGRMGTDKRMDRDDVKFERRILNSIYLGQSSFREYGAVTPHGALIDQRSNRAGRV